MALINSRGSMVYLVEKTTKVHMNTVSIGRVQQYILSMTISKTNNVPDYGHDSSRTTERLSTGVPKEQN